MKPVTIPVRVDTTTMLAAKLGNALAPRQLTLFAVSAALLGVGLATVLGRGVLETTLVVGVVLVVLRGTVMVLSARVDEDARRRFGGTLTLSSEGLELTGRDGAREQHPWSWLRSARLGADHIVMQLEPRGGRVWMALSLPNLSERGVLAQVEAHLRAAGKLADR